MAEPLIPAEAVQAAIEGIDHESIERHGLDRPAILAILRAAAPFLAEQVLRDAAEIAHLTGTDSATGARNPTARATWRMVAKWLRARAVLARTEPTKEPGHDA